MTSTVPKPPTELETSTTFDFEEVPLNRTKTSKSEIKTILCDNCLVKYNCTVGSTFKFYLCYTCEMYLCEKCYPGHEQHENIEVNERPERQKAQKKFVDDLRAELQRDREFRTENPNISDRVEIKCELDKKDCVVYGFSCFQRRHWLVCDTANKCVKMFDIGTNMLQRYFRFISCPWDAAEVTTLDFVGDVEKVNLLAVTVPDSGEIYFIDPNCVPAKKVKSVHLDKTCYLIDSNDNKLYTVCIQEAPYTDKVWSVYVLSNTGDKLGAMQTDIAVLSFPEYGVKKYHVPKPGVHKGKIYLSEYWQNKIHCLNEQDGSVLSYIIIPGCWPSGLGVDDSDFVYVTSFMKNEVYKLDYKLSGYSQLTLNTIPLDQPDSLYCYGSRLFISHWIINKFANFVTVIRHGGDCA